MSIKSIYDKIPFLFPSICLWGGCYLVVKYWQVNTWIGIFGFICFCYGLIPKISAIRVFANHSVVAKKVLIGLIIANLIFAAVLAYTFW